MYTLRTRIGKDIVAEFLPPLIFAKKTRKEYPVVILAKGFPSMPGSGGLLEFFSRKGFFTVMPRYRGTWESGGKLFERSPAEDLCDVVGTIRKGKLKDLWNERTVSFCPGKIFLIGSSFGGTAALLAARDTHVHKVVAISPLVDWRRESRAEPIKKLAKFSKKAFGEGFRVKNGAWEKIKKGTFFNPIHEVKNIPGEKILIIHAKDDDIVHYLPVHKFAKQIGASFISSKHGGHMGLGELTKMRYWKRIHKFLRT